MPLRGKAILSRLGFGRFESAMLKIIIGRNRAVNVSLRPVDGLTAENVQDGIEEVNASVGNLQTDVGGLQGDVDELQTDVDGLNDSVGNLGDAVNNLGGAVGNIENTITEITQTGTNSMFLKSGDGTLFRLTVNNEGALETEVVE